MGCPEAVCTATTAAQAAAEEISASHLAKQVQVRQDEQVRQEIQEE